MKGLVYFIFITELVIIAFLKNPGIVDGFPQAAGKPSESAKDVVDRILKRSPLIDGHNDFAWNLRKLAMNDLRKVDFKSDLTKHPAFGSSNESHTDLPRMRKGGFGGQFWAAFTECESQLKDSVEQTLEQIDVLKRFFRAYKEDLHYSTSVADIMEAMSKGKIASLIGVEGGHSIQSNYGILRTLYELGARYMTLTHSCNNPWADSSPVDKNDLSSILPEHNGLSPFGLGVIDEMNRLGMMVDLSHVSAATMKAALGRSKAPVIFSHSGSRAIANHHRNVPDDVLQLVKTTNSIVMVNFFSEFLKINGTATLEDVVAHVEYIRIITGGTDHIGIGGDYDGVDKLPEELKDVSKIRNLFEALWSTGRWTEEDLEKLSSKNILRVFADVEKVRDSLSNELPKEDALPIGAYWHTPSITSNFF